MQNDIKKSRNNTLTSPICEIKGYLDDIVNFMVKVNHRLHNSVAELDIANLTSRFFQYFITSPLMITALRDLKLCNLINRSFNTYQTQSIHI